MDKRNFLWLLAQWCLVTFSYGQGDYNARYQNAYSFVQQKDYPRGLEEFKKLNTDYPAMSNVYVQIGWCYLQSGNLSQAVAFAEGALFLDQFNVSAYAIHSYALLASGKEQEGYQSLQTALWLLPDEDSFKYFLQDFDDIISAGYYAGIFQKVKQQANAMVRSRDKSFLAINASIGSGYQAAIAGRVAEAIDNCRAATDVSLPKNYEVFKGFVMQLAGRMFTYTQKEKEAIPFLEKALAEFSRYSFANAFVRTTTVTALAEAYLRSFDNQKAFDLMSNHIASVQSLPAWAGIERARFFTTYCNAASRLNKNNTVREFATLLIAEKNLGQEEAWLKCNGHNFLAMAYEAETGNQNLEIALDNFKQAVAWADRADLGNMKSIVLSNYALYLQKIGKGNEANSILSKSVQESLKRGDYLSAETSYNNMGAIYLRAHQYADAAQMFRESIAIIEQYRNQFKGEEKLNFMARSISSYQFLVMSLTQMHDSPALFEVQNKERGRVLAELLGNNSWNHSITLTEFQKMLQPDETAILYSLTEPGSVVIHVVNKTSTYSTINDKFEMFINLKKRFLDRMQHVANRPGYKPVLHAEATGEAAALQLQQEDMDNFMQVTRELLQTNIPERLPFLQQFTSAYYDFLIRPVETKITGRKLILFPDGLLNFLPFEALTDSEGNYLVQKYDIRYVQSADVKRLIENRNYSRPAKSLLAMGGAKFEQMAEQAEPLGNIDQLLELQTLAAANAEQGKSQRKIYASLGFGKMNYLEGSLAEVKKLQELFGAGADVYTGDQMTETGIKKLSSSGQLQNYRIIHLATHGFALPQIPQLSGVAMSIFASQQGNEDGYLTAPEIARLNMHADVAVLSACETGLGKIYGGEGVSGLTQALLVGGANRAIVSLWPVSDEGTMYFMSGLYDLTERQGKSYDEAVNSMKRKFISGAFGELFKMPGIWAPFVHYGK